MYNTYIAISRANQHLCCGIDIHIIHVYAAKHVFIAYIKKITILVIKEKVV